MQSPARTAIIAVLAALGIYLVVLPLFWPAPEVAASIPDTVSLSEDLQIPIVVKAWHSNVRLGQVRFYVDHSASTAKGPKGLFDPAVLLEAAPPPPMGFFARNILTRPWSKRFEVTVPLRDFAQQELLGQGLLVGKLDVTLNCPVVTLGKRAAGTPRGRTIPVMRSVPFQITVTE
jgi:hypothetical protein